MSNKKSWIPWNDRIDLKELCLTISYEFYGESSCDVISLKRKIPKHCLSKIEIDIYSYLRSQYVYYFNLTIEEVKLLAIDCNKEQLTTISKDRLEYRGFFASNINDIYSIIDDAEQIDKGKFLRENNEWIPWNNREDLENVYLLMKTDLESQVSAEFLENVGVLGITEDAPCYSETSVIFSLGKIPDKFLVDNIRDIAWGEFGLSCCSNVQLNLLTESELSETQKRIAKSYKSSCEQNGYKNDSVYLTVLEIVRDYENSDRERFLRKEKNTLSEESTSVSVVNDSPAAPVAPIASVEHSIGRNENYPSTWIYAKDDEAAPAFDENGATGMVVVANTARIANNTDLLPVIAETLQKMAEFQQENACTASAPITDAPAADQVVDDSSTVLTVPEYDNPNDWIHLPELAQEMVNNDLSVDTKAAQKNLHNQKSKGRKSEETYDGEHSLYGVSIHGKWRMVQQGVKWLTYFYRPSLTLKMNPEK
ncbi:MAG: hypothetical protein IKS45_03655 [Thermoguttaceae bacterium]|nr:hypothetical protein [Thermoguttaceae bacterium]MBR6435579.1 hypothetical protein [Thermoguttaceae bacterium]